MDADQVWSLVKDAKNIFVAKGKKMMNWNPARDDRDQIIKSIIGPSGNLRAPTWRIGSDYLVGFHPDQYNQVLG